MHPDFSHLGEISGTIMVIQDLSLFVCYKSVLQIDSVFHFFGCPDGYISKLEIYVYIRDETLCHPK